MVAALYSSFPLSSGMWFPVSTVAALCVLLDITDAVVNNNELDLIFRDRSQSQWEEAWHNERYTRCRETLLRHLYWACEKDIYRITRRSSTGDDHKIYSDESEIGFPWLTERQAKFFLRNRRGARRRSGSSITAECCSVSGCTWEEYAEYCPTNKRIVTYV